MYKILIVFFAITIIVGVAEAWVAQGIYHNDAHPGKCAITETLIISPGETVKSPKGCSKMTCYSEEGRVKITGCGAVLPPKGCSWGEHVDVHAPFNKCCARHLICEGGMTDETRAYEQHIWNMFDKKATTTNDIETE